MKFRFRFPSLFSASWVLPVLLLLLNSCEKEVQLDIGEGTGKLVVEGLIETGMPPTVLLSRSFGFLEPIDPGTMSENLISGARVTVSHGEETMVLKEWAKGFYSVDTSAAAPYFVGENGKFYDLRIEWEGQVYEARTKIPHPVILDSVYSTLPLFPPKDNPMARQIGIRFKDPDTLGNFWRYYTRINQGPLLPPTNSVISDEYSNGTWVESSLVLGTDRSRSVGLDSLGFAHVGDTVTLKWATIDRNTYDFWHSFEFSLATLGSPFASPIQVKSNLSNGALGIWGGYGTVYRTILITE